MAVHVRCFFEKSVNLVKIGRESGQDFRGSGKMRIIPGDELIMIFITLKKAVIRAFCQNILTQSAAEKIRIIAGIRISEAVSQVKVFRGQAFRRELFPLPLVRVQPICGEIAEAVQHEKCTDKESSLVA